MLVAAHHDTPPVVHQTKRHTPHHTTTGEVVYLPQLENNALGRGLLTLLGAYSRKQQLRNGAAVLYQAVTEAAESAELQQGETLCWVQRGACAATPADAGY